MWNTLKATLWQTRRNVFLRVGLFYVLASMLLIIAEDFSPNATGSLLAGDAAQMLCVWLPMLVGWNTAAICGTDLGDKTANYELLFVKMRSDVNIGRRFAALIVIFVIVTLLTLLLPVVGMIANGWGGSLPAKAALMHFASIYPVIFRLVCVYTAITFLCMNMVVPLAISFIGTMLVMLSSVLIAETGTDVKLTWQTASSDCMRLLDLNNKTTGFFEGQDITVYKSALTGSIMLESLTASLVIGTVCLLLSYAVFRRRDVM